MKTVFDMATGEVIKEHHPDSSASIESCFQFEAALQLQPVVTELQTKKAHKTMPPELAFESVDKFLAGQE